jgi:peptidoglycan hydrolase CwlO-like protein
MAVMAREAWTDERLDDLNAKVEKGFGEVKGELRDLRKETKAESQELRAEVNVRFNSIEGRFNSIDARFDALQRTMVLGVVSMSATIVGALLVIRL